MGQEDPCHEQAFRSHLSSQIQLKMAGAVERIDAHAPCYVAGPHKQIRAVQGEEEPFLEGVRS